MKKMIVSVVCLILSAGTLMAQAGFSYQAVIRKSDGSLRANESLLLDVELIRDNAAIYTESHSVTTNDFGVFSIVVGEGAGEDTYSPTLFLNSDSSSIPETWLRVSESGGSVLSQTKILGVPVADVARIALNVAVTFPVGSVIPFAGGFDKIPGDWLLCDGTVYEITAYPELFAAIGYNWGSPDANHFRVPDLRGVFLRGVNSGIGDDFSDPDRESRISRHPGGNIGNTVGSYQGDQFKSHTHTSKESIMMTGYCGLFSGGSYGCAASNPAVNNTGGSETRPRNAYVHYIIKY